MIRSLRGAWCTVLLAGCGSGDRPQPETVPPPAQSAVPDSLVFTTPGGTAVWLTEAREGTDSVGGRCLERTIELRRDTTRLKVPLLYTSSVPRLLDDSTLTAELTLRCRGVAIYQVSVRTGQPTRMGDPPR